MKKKVFVIVDSLGPGGTQRQLIELLKYINREKFSVLVINLDTEVNILEPNIRNLGVEVINISHYGLFNIKTLRALTKIFRNYKPDIVFTYLFTADCYGRLAAKLAGVPVVVSSVRSTDPWQRWYHRMAEKILAVITNKIIVNAEIIKQELCIKKGIHKDKIEVIYNGIDISRFDNVTPAFEIRRRYNIPEEAIVVGMVSRFSFEKDYNTFFQAAGKVLDRVNNCYFLAVGGGGQLEEYQEKVAQLPYKDRVIFAEYQKDVPSFINAMDICVLSSNHEGCPNVILEYMASSKPTVATDVGGVKELIVDGQTGYVVPPHNAQILAERITKLARDVQSRKSMGEAGRKRVEDKFTVDKMVKNTEMLLEELTRGRIAFILSQFPEMHETFILREFKQLEKSKVVFNIFSLKPCRDPIIHPSAKKLIPHTIYAKFSLVSIIKGILSSPLRSFSALIYITKTYWPDVKEYLKALYVLGECFYLAQVMIKIRVVHIHSHWATMPTTAAVILNKLTGIPFSFTAHAWDIFISQCGLKEKIEKSRFCVTCTDYNRKYLSNLADSNELSRKIYLNYHGLELDRFPFRQRQCNNGVINILSVGRLVETKGFKYLIDACNILNQKKIDFKCKIVGKGPLLGRLNSRVRECKLEDRVEFLGPKTQEEIKNLYSEATVLVQASVIAKNGDRDGIPNVILEAMAIGLPVISTNISGIPEVVIDKETGIVVPANDSKALAEAIINLAKDKKLQDRISFNARKLIEEKFSAQKNTSNLVDIFVNNSCYNSDYLIANRYPLNANSRDTHDAIRDTRINILYVIWSLGLGGAEQVVINLAKGLDRERFNPLVCCLNDKGVFAQELEKESIKVIPLHKRGKLDISVISKLISVIKQYRIDIVHTHLWGANTWGRIAAKLAGVKVVIATEHNTDVWKPYYYFSIDRILCRFTDKIIAVSKKVKKFYVKKGIPEEKIEVVYNGVEIRTQRHNVTTSHVIKNELGIDGGETVLAVIGRLVPQKGHRYFLLALKELLGQYRAKGLIIGSGPLDKQLKEFSQQLGLNGNVIFTGLREDVPELLKAVDILVMPSLREGLPIVLLEAMSAGVPVIAANVGGIPEVIVNGKNGVLVEPDNSKALKDAVVKVIENESLRREIIDNARDSIKQKFNFGNMVKNTQKLYDKLLKEKNYNGC